ATEDPIQAAIERAKAKKAAQQSEAGNDVSPVEKLEQAVATTQKRLDTAIKKLEEAKSSGSDLVDALQTGVDKTRAKLDKAEQALREQQAADAPKDDSGPGDAVPDPAKLAIEKAMAARAAEAELNPEEKARQQREKLEQRLAKAKDRLAAGQAAGEEDKILEALIATVARLEEKIAAAGEDTPKEPS
ncbi:MAG: electron transport complex subunit RsxC, partial [Halieaceae bacterium]